MIKTNSLFCRKIEIDSEVSKISMLEIKITLLARLLVKIFFENAIPFGACVNFCVIYMYILPEEELQRAGNMTIMSDLSFRAKGYLLNDSSSYPRNQLALLYIVISNDLSTKEGKKEKSHI